MTHETFDIDDVMAELDRKRTNKGLVGLWYWTGYAFYRLRDKKRDIPRQIKWAYQRVVRGWDDQSVWSLDSHLTNILGQQLVKMSEIAHGWPSSQGFETFEEWVEALKTHGEALLTYQEKQYSAFGFLDGDEWDAIYQPARTALIWVADNLGGLWD